MFRLHTGRKMYSSYCRMKQCFVDISDDTRSHMFCRRRRISCRNQQNVVIKSKVRCCFLKEKHHANMPAMPCKSMRIFVLCKTAKRCNGWPLKSCKSKEQKIIFRSSKTDINSLSTKSLTLQQLVLFELHSSGGGGDLVQCTVCPFESRHLLRFNKTKQSSALKI